ncbi:uncharacterized protein LOC115391592 [Salarias fasciatus]|uniref:uncharacterized protein LOC115391592 n=1 Tax=Salarias fasciatus TaxID=181472 RepID=UPI0011765FD7|nr:uncharacterized protein LOC115391592 [Salarias fasciatus]
MEQEYVAGLYQALGKSPGAEFSSEDVSFLYRKVFHVSSSTSDANAAIKKITRSDNSRSCVTENILDVLLEMEREREKKESLFWDLQLLNAGNLNHVMDWMQQSTDPAATLEMAYSSDSGSSQPCTIEAATPEMETMKLCGRVTSVRKLKKAARQCWARLVTEGLQSMLPSFCKAQGAEIRCQAWGCVSLSDLLLLVEVKYDVVTHLLYTEMLQEHHAETVWKMLLPWQQHREEEGLEDLAEEALESADALRMAELPGAFRIYRDIHTRTKVSFNGFVQSCPDSKPQCWTAVSFLNDLHILRQHERHTLAVLSERLNGEGFRLVCLHIRLATLRAQREKTSYGALLAARQSWETWPRVYSPCRAERVTLWLFGDKEEEEEVKEDTKTVQQALLQLLVVTQEQERKHLVRLVHEVSPEDLQDPGCTVPSQVESHMHAALRFGCIKRLRQVYAWLQSETLSEQTNLQPVSQIQLENCGLLLLSQLLELQEVQASAFLQVLVNNQAQQIQALHEEYKREIQAKCFSNLLHLLTSDDPLTPGSVRHPYWIENSGGEKTNAQPCYTRLADEAQDASGAFTDTQMDVLSRGASGAVNEVQSTDEADKHDLCSGCGAVMEDLPYLEILCVPDARSDAQETPPAEGGAQTEDRDAAAKTQQSFEKQGSLITLAWSQLPEDGTDSEMEAAAGDTGQNLHIENTQVQPPQSEEKNEECSLLQRTLAGQQDAQPEKVQYSTVEQVILNAAPIDDQPMEGQSVSKCNLQTETESPQAIQPPLLTDPSEADPHADDPCSETSNTISNAGREGTEGEMSPIADESEVWDLPEAEPCQHEGQECHPGAAVDRSLSEMKTEREPREPVSAMERERTMRNLVDMQRKVEQKQQRDRERQLLRVQERLSIIQNRKAEEDLLGLKHTDRLKHLTHDLLLEDRNQQKTIVKERLEQLRRERSYIMQSKRDRNTAGFKELLGPVVLHGRETEDGADWDTTTV